PPAVIVVQMDDAGPSRSERLPGEPGELWPVLQVARAHAEHVGTDPRQVGTGRGRRNHRSGRRAAAVHPRRREGSARAQMADDGYDRRIRVQLLRHPHGGVLVPRIIEDSQLDLAAPDAPVGVDLVHRQLGRPEHRGATRLGEGARESEAFERAWEEPHVDRLAWEALGCARRADSEVLEPALDQVDRRLLATLERCRAFPDPHVVTFRVPELERWQHAAAAALVGARWGVAGLRTVIADTGAPLGRRYFAFLALAERHPEGAWPLFERYL